MLKVEHTPNISVVRSVETDALIAEFFGPEKVELAEAYLRWINGADTAHQRIETHNGYQLAPAPTEEFIDTGGDSVVPGPDFDSANLPDPFDGFNGGSSGGAGAASTWEDTVPVPVGGTSVPDVPVSEGVNASDIGSSVDVSSPFDSSSSGGDTGSSFDSGSFDSGSGSDDSGSGF